MKIQISLSGRFGDPVAIMNASSWIPGRNTPEQLVEKIRGDGWTKGTLLAVTVVSLGPLDKVKSMFILGSSGNYGKVGTRLSYMIDTGMGYRHTDKLLKIENIIQIDAKGKLKAVNDVGMSEKRQLWVFK